MLAAASFPEVEQDQHVILRDMCWQDFEALLALRGDRAGVRMYYLDGEVELTGPAKIHEGRKKALARLLELWALETDLDLNGFGAWTLKHERREAGAEPDECYILGPSADREVPDLVIEVEWSRAMGLAKHEIYRRLGIRELWTLKSSGKLVVRALEGEAWVEVANSRLLPQLDLTWLLSFLDADSQSEAVRALRDALRARSGQ
jgi:Uma2 family endonuclease